MVRWIAIRFTMALVGILLALVLSECGVRCLVSGPDRPPVGASFTTEVHIGAEKVKLVRRRLKDVLLVTDFRPGQRACAKDGRCATIDPNGIRRDPQQPLVPDHTSGLRIAMVGDSFTFGYGVGDRQTLPDHLERLVRRHGFSGGQVLNFGVDGYNAAQVYRVVGAKVLRFKPAIIIYNFSVNDPEHYPQVGNPTLTEAVGAIDNVEWAPFEGLLLRSRLFEHLFVALLNRKRKSMVERADSADKEREYFTTLYSSPGLWIVRRSLEGMQNTVRNAGVPLVVVILPALSSDLRSLVVSRIQDICRKLGIPTIDVTFPVSKRRRMWTTHGPQHYNDEGNRLVAESILRGMQRYLPHR
jgi:hypothetical protein